MFIYNPFEENEASNTNSIPNFTKGRFMLLRMVPPKTKGIRDGLVATFGMLSYEDSSSVSVPTIEVQQTTAGYVVSFPKGKRGLLSTKFRGPKSWYNFVDNATGKKYHTGLNNPQTGINNKATVEAAEAKLSVKIPDWDQLTDESRDIEIDKYFEDFYTYGLAKDLNLNPEPNKETGETDPTQLPVVGMVTDLYREYTPPAGDEKYGRTIVSKYFPKKGLPNLSGEYQIRDAEIAAAIYEGLTTTVAPVFDFPTVENSDEEEPF